MIDLDARRRIPRCMSTQHPDNVTVPFFAQGPVMEGMDEIREAYYAFSHLGCDEQMWDFEGKEVDEFVVEKLLTTYEGFFRAFPLGREMFLTLRVPNPGVEKAQGKILLEVLQGIPRANDVARLFYGEDVAPIFEIIFPMTTSAEELNRVLRYYQVFVTGKGEAVLTPGDIPLKEWIGEFHPAAIQIIPLIEDKDSLLRADTIVRAYLQGKDLPYQRVFLARSDPALNYGSLAASLLVKVALSRLDRLEQELGIPIYTILGAGSAPFRGNFRPDTVERHLAEHPSVQTFTIQSAFKYDYPAPAIIRAIETLKSAPRKNARPVEPEGKVIELIERISACYQRQVRAIAPLMNHIAPAVPRRRMRKLHIGLFGYSRSLGGVSLPRAISFCAALYSLGLPPEILGLACLNQEDLAFLREVDPGFEADLQDALRYLNEEALALLPPTEAEEIRTTIRLLPLTVPQDHAHREVTATIIKRVKDGNVKDLGDLILRAAWIRKFLG
ncbi:phosphoenolpyruvate carboxylase [Candidatus Methylomirabilis lanthanidiphila]|uniref:Phosphoenolpyruvate carboxylase n=1 Tax=Candidatus Methylomirabilis lanthanidiphila TaxID=2211376 RepID=A0A564ZIT4_9BACT|nr:phosphoenolpyruvate carboxylase [Candidatus Methylomirabilis lanthanidiphila]VUZ85225.1 phosphoenolpyruvate carboxylase [Candidatus Methylomirabilis lanthanidiphila]